MFHIWAVLALLLDHNSDYIDIQILYKPLIVFESFISVFLLALEPI